MALNALGRHLALVGFMGAGKSSLLPELAERLGRPGRDVDENATKLIEPASPGRSRPVSSPVVGSVSTSAQPGASSPASGS